MAKTSCSRKKGIQRGIAKRHFASKQASDGLEDKNDRTADFEFLCFGRSNLSLFAEKCFDFLLATCEKFHLIGFTRAQDGTYVPLSHNNKIWHIVTAVLGLAFCIQKTWGTVQMFLYEELRVQSFMCLCLALVYDGAVLLTMGVVWRPRETMDLLNSWTHISDSLRKMNPGSKCHPLENTPACLKVISGFLVTQGIPIAVAFCSLLMDDLPIFMFTTAERSGLLPEGICPKWAWQLMFAPLEWLMAQPFMMLTSLSTDFLFMETGILEIYLRQLQNVNVTGMQSRRSLERLYEHLELFNRIGQVWIRFYFPPYLFALATTVIVTVFVTIRYTDLPLILYIFFPYTAMTVMILMFWQSYNMFRTTRASEYILGKLRQHEAPYFNRMTRAERIEKMQRSKAMRPLVFSIADSEFSLNLPINTWDEIVNQTLFLLSL